ncbi:hypothetical protein NQ318_000886 [Aromia moschata]|uniref:Uncharacterized protein n=1 Tax=Aromia moschata TaxID=1265417 RepID=A0AAV8ZGK5_9CUCU|nr:hypothetical protein NQ318_000886 [Aromia moschata]
MNSVDFLLINKDITYEIRTEIKLSARKADNRFDYFQNRLMGGNRSAWTQEGLLAAMGVASDCGDGSVWERRGKPKIKYNLSSRLSLDKKEDYQQKIESLLDPEHYTKLEKDPIKIGPKSMLQRKVGP